MAATPKSTVKFITYFLVSCRFGSLFKCWKTRVGLRSRPCLTISYSTSKRELSSWPDVCTSPNHFNSLTWPTPQSKNCNDNITACPTPYTTTHENRAFLLFFKKTSACNPSPATGKQSMVGAQLTHKSCSINAHFQIKLRSLSLCWSCLTTAPLTTNSVKGSNSKIDSIITT